MRPEDRAMTEKIKFGRLGFERGTTLADQYDFYARGDLAYCEATIEYKQALAEHLRDEYEKARQNGGVFSDGSRFLPP